MAVTTSTPNDLMVVFSNTITSGFAALSGPVNGVFGTMIVLVVALTGIQWALSPNRELLASAVTKILLIGAFAWLINDWQALSETIYRGFLQLGLTAGGGGVTTADFFNPGAILEEGWKLVKAMGDIQTHGSGPLDVVGNITDALILAVAMIGVMLSFAILALQIIVALLEFKIVTLGGFVLLPFGIWSKSAFLAERPLGYVVSAGLKVLALGIVVSGAKTVFGQLTPSADPDVYEALAILVASLLLALLAFFIPNLAASLVTGGPTLGAGSALTAGLAVGGTAALGVGALVGAGAAMGGGAGAKIAGSSSAAAGAGSGRAPPASPGGVGGGGVGPGGGGGGGGAAQPAGASPQSASSRGSGPTGSGSPTSSPKAANDGRPGPLDPLTLQPGETLVDKAAGDTVRWEIGETTSGSGAGARTLVMLKPLTAGLSTNMVLTTSQRVYLIDLTSTAKKADRAIAWTVVAIRQPTMARAYLRSLGFPAEALLLKRVVATSGTVCAKPDGVAADGRVFVRHRRDRLGGALPQWGECRPLNGEVFLAGDDGRSFDSRYFGPVRIRSIVGVYERLP